MSRGLEVPVLKISMVTAISKIQELLGEAEKITQISIETKIDADLIIRKSYQWLEKARAFMDQAFDDQRFSVEYLGPVARTLLPAHKAQSPKNVKPLDLQQALELSISRISTLAERLPLFTQDTSAADIDTTPPVNTATSSEPKDAATGSSRWGIKNPQATTTRNIFLVHGHDEGRKLEVARFIESHPRLKAVILHEEPNRGKTIIEKLEDGAGKAAFAVILMTADDMGAGIDELPVKQNSAESFIPVSESSIKKFKHRARQNVVLELGYFIGKLGRHCVCVLHDVNVELPSDVAGIAAIALQGQWRHALARELRAADLID